MGFHREDMDESQDFYGGDYSDLLGVEDKVGDIVNSEGKVLGHHNGFWHYTIGQRKGLGIAAPRPLYVIALDSVKNQVVVGYDEETHQTQVNVKNVNYVSRTDFEEDKIYTVKIRSASNGDAAHVIKTEDGFVVKFLSYVKAATCGQSAVVYDNDVLIAGGIIDC